MQSALRRMCPLAALIVTVAGCQSPPPTTASTAGAQDSADASPRIEWGLVIHGGAGTILRERMTPALEQEYRAALTESLRAGQRVLADGGSSLDAVIAAIVLLEDSPLFNAGRGAVFTADGVNSLDASIMDGSTLRAGAVAGVTDVKNPIVLARLVMDKSPHVMLSGTGAERFAREQGIPSTPREWFSTERRWKELQDAKAGEAKQTDKAGTVGAIALDRSGRLAVGTSTGGMTNKKWGRIGDSPIVGAGTYANARCAVSGTGWGEYFIRNAVAYDICARVEYTKASIETAAADVIMTKLPQQEKNTGGVIAMDGDGRIATPFNTAGMYRGWIDQNGASTVAIFAGE
jgi:L-asparaginase / beta-aspartyl-peptidase